MNNSRIVILVSLFSLVMVGLAFAQGPSQGPAPGGESEIEGCPPYEVEGMTYNPNPIVNAIDTNMDNLLTHEEWTTAGAPEASWNMFMEKDKSKKGYITREEFIAETPPNGIDKNCDGYISIWEFRATAQTAPPGGGDAPQGGPPRQ